MYTSKELNDIIGALTASGARVRDYRIATKGGAVTLSDAMSAILGHSRRRVVPFLATAVGAIAGKLHVREIVTAAATPRKKLGEWLKTSGWDLLERELWEAVVRDGEGFVLVTPDPDGLPRLTRRDAFDGTEGAAMHYSAATGSAEWGVNIWRDGDNTYADLYFPERVEKYVREGEGDWKPRTDLPGEEWPLDWTDADGAPLGIALVHFCIGGSDIEAALTIQRDFNDALIDLQAISRAQGWPQRYIRQEGQVEYLTNQNGQPIRLSDGTPVRRPLRLEPGSLLPLRGANSELGQLPAASLDRTLVDVYLELLSLTTTVPTHYFRGNWPSGIALVQAETRLNSLVESHQAALTGSLVRLFRLMLAVAKTFGSSELDPALELEVAWYPPQVETEDLVREREAHTVELYGAGLMSLETALRRLHPDWTDEQVQKELEAIRAEKKAAAALAPRPALTPEDPEDGRAAPAGA